MLFFTLFFLLIWVTNAEDFKFAVIGDTGTGSTNQYAVAKELEKHVVDFVVHVGDMMYPLGYNSDSVHEKLIDPYKNINVPFLSIMGNHDSRTNSAALLEGIKQFPKFYLPSRFYSIELKGVKFIMVDSMILANDYFWRGNTKWTAEKGYDFIKKELKTDRDVILVAHYPLYSISKHGSQFAVADKIKNLDTSNKIKMILSGHSHVLEFLQHNGFNQVVSGSGSKVDTAEPYKFQFKNDQNKFIKHTLGFVIIELKGNIYSIYFIDHLGNILFTENV